MRTDERWLDLWLLVTAEGLAGNGPELSARQTAMLLMLARGEAPLSLAELSLALRLPRPAAARALARLAEAGLVRRPLHPQTGRALAASLTPAGQDAVRRLSAAIAAAADKLSLSRPAA